MKLFFPHEGLSGSPVTSHFPLYNLVSFGLLLAQEILLALSYDNVKLTPMPLISTMRKTLKIT